MVMPTLRARIPDRRSKSPLDMRECLELSASRASDWLCLYSRRMILRRSQPQYVVACRLRDWHLFELKCTEPSAHNALLREFFPVQFLLRASTPSLCP